MVSRGIPRRPTAFRCRTPGRMCWSLSPAARNEAQEHRRPHSRAVADRPIRCRRRDNGNCAHWRVDRGCWVRQRRSRPSQAQRAPSGEFQCGWLDARSERSRQAPDFRRGATAFGQDRRGQLRHRNQGSDQGHARSPVCHGFHWPPPGSIIAKLSRWRGFCQAPAALALLIVGLGDDQRPVDLVFRGRRIDRRNSHTGGTRQEHIGAVRT